MQTVTPQIPTSPMDKLHLAVHYPTITTHLFQPPVYLHSLTFQRFTEVLPRQNPHYHYFPSLSSFSLHWLAGTWHFMITVLLVCVELADRFGRMMTTSFSK